MSSTSQSLSVLITGATGLLGSHVVKLLLDKSTYNFAVLVRNDQQAKIWETFGIKTVIGDLENPSFSIPPTIETIIHIAAIAGDWVDKTKAYAVNVQGTEYLIREADKIGCKKFIYVSTIGVYGHIPYLQASEAKDWHHSSTYENSKIDAEKFIQEFKQANNTSLEFIILRPSSMYGEGDRYIIPTYSKYLKKGKMLLIGGGKSLYPIMHANDAAAVLISLLEGDKTGENGLAIYNLSDDSEITQKEFISLIKENIGVKDELKSIPYLPAYMASILFEIKGKLTHKEPRIFRKRVKYLGVTRNVCIDKARKELGFTPHWMPQQGIPEVIKALEEEENYKANGIETKVVNGIQEKEILEVIPYHLFKELKK